MGSTFGSPYLGKLPNVVECFSTLGAFLRPTLIDFASNSVRAECLNPFAGVLRKYFCLPQSHSRFARFQGRSRFGSLPSHQSGQNELQSQSLLVDVHGTHAAATIRKHVCDSCTVWWFPKGGDHSIDPTYCNPHFKNPHKEPLIKEPLILGNPHLFIPTIFSVQSNPAP